MSFHKSIGGFFSLENTPENQDLHPYSLKLNSARNALRLIIREHSIGRIFLPFYTCPVVWDVVLKEGCSIVPYDVDINLRPIINTYEVSDYFVYTNYFGICDNEVRKLYRRLGGKLIVDNSQAFFSSPVAPLSFYSPRKFFGLPDGGLLYGVEHKQLPLDKSFGNSGHLLKQIDEGKENSYKLFKTNDDAITNKEIGLMSPLTLFLYNRIYPDHAADIRKRNFNYLYDKLQKNNKIKIDESSISALSYPFWSDNSSLRNYLISNKVYVPCYWPQTNQNQCMSSPLSQELSHHIIPLPIDQRYGIEEMKIIVGLINNFLYN